MNPQSIATYALSAAFAVVSVFYRDPWFAGIASALLLANGFVPKAGPTFSASRMEALEKAVKEHSSVVNGLALHIGYRRGE